MSKYPPGESIVGAVYDNAPIDNPFLAAMPEMLGIADFNFEIRSFPKLPHDLPSMTSEERRQALTLLSSIFVPMDYMYSLYDQMYRAIRSTYATRTMLEEIRQTRGSFIVLPWKAFGPMPGKGTSIFVYHRPHSIR